MESIISIQRYDEDFFNMTKDEEDLYLDPDGCKLPLCSKYRIIRHYPFCRTCITELLKYFVQGAKKTQQFKYDSEADLANRYTRYIQDNWRLIVKDEQKVLDEMDERGTER